MDNYVSERKLKYAIGFKKFLNFAVFAIAFGFLFNEIHEYSTKAQYADDSNSVKYHDFGYAVYDESNKLKEIYFYDGAARDKDFNIVSYVKKNIVLQNDEDLLVRIMKKEGTWNQNYVKIFGMEKQETVEMAGYKVKSVLRTEDEDSFILTYVHNMDGGKSNYCFAVNTLLMEDSKNFCIMKFGSSLPMNVMSYGEYYFVTIDADIYVYSKDYSKIISIIKGKSPIEGISKNEFGDIKIRMSSGTKEIKSLMLEYYVIRKLQGDEVDLKKLTLNDL